ncbi:hypothetical protein Efla_003703 [Eimeria flavescens]
MRPQRHAQYLQRGQRFGSRLPPAPLGSSEKRTLHEKQAALEERLDSMLDDSNVQIVVRQLENCRLSLEAEISGEVTRQLWELTLTSLRASLRQSLHASALTVSQAVLMQQAGGPAAVRRKILRFIAEAVARKAKLRHNARILGSVDFEEDVNVVADRLSPGSPLNLRLSAEAFPKISFKRPYKGLKLRVRRQPYAKGTLFRVTEKYLLFKHSDVVYHPDPHPVAKEGDTVDLKVDRGWFEEPDGSMGLEIPSKYIKGPTTLHLVKPWLPNELLQSMEGAAAGERRTIRVAIPFKARHLLSICEQQGKERGDDSAPAASSVSEIEFDNQANEGSLVSVYLDSIANRTKENVFATLLGDGTDAAFKANDIKSSSSELQREGLTEPPEEAAQEERETCEEEKEGLEADQEEEYNVDCLLEVECLSVKQRVVPEADDKFFLKICGMTRAQLWDEVEASAESFVIEAAFKYALGAAAAALDEIAEAEIPDSLIELQAKATWKQQLKARELQGEDNSKINTPEGYSKWKEANKQSVANVLKTSYAIQAVYQKEGLEVDERQMQAEIGKAMLHAPTESAEFLAKQVYKKAQARLVYDFIVKHADLEYYVDETPAQVTVVSDGERKAQHGVKAFPRGTNIEQWQTKREEKERERDTLRETAQRFFVDHKTLRKFDKKDGL